MAKVKISISIDEELIAKIKAVAVLEKRSSFSNALTSLVEIDNYYFIETTSKCNDNNKSFVANKSDFFKLDLK